MARYDVSLADERGAVRADQHRDWSDFRARGGYARDFDPRNATSWRPPSDLRGYRGGSAGSYGFGDDYDVVRRGAERNRGTGAFRTGGTGRTRSEYDRDFARRPARGGRGYDREMRGLHPDDPLTREIRYDTADLVRDYLREDPEYRRRGGWSIDEIQGRRGGYGTEFRPNRSGFGGHRPAYGSEYVPRRRSG